MARKFGKKKEISLNPLSYNIGVAGISGIGKSTLVKKVCEKLVGDDGYIMLDIGRESGHDCIEGIVSETVRTWEELTDVIDDIVENRSTDYKDLKVVVFDTYDELFAIAEPEVIKMHNKENPKKRVKSIKSAFGGFQAGEDKAIEIVLDKLWSLKKVGVSFIVIGHTKSRNVTDAVTGEDYLQLTTNMSQKYFNAIKTKVHFLGVASIDREIVKENTGKKNIVTKQEITKGVIKSQTRKITFRDDNYVIDSKSRFADIVDSIPFDVDELINAIANAIKSELSKSGKSYEDAKKEQEKAIKEKFEELEKNEIESKNQKELSEAISDVTKMISKYKNDMDVIKLIMTKVKELGYDNQINIDKIDDVNSLKDYIETLN